MMKRMLATLICSLAATSANAVPPWVEACEARAKAEVGNLKGFKLIESGAVERGEGRCM